MSKVAFSKLSALPKSYTVPAGYRLARFIVKGKGDDASGYALMPEVSDAFLQSFLTREEGIAAVKDLIESYQDKIARAAFSEGKAYVTEEAIKSMDAICAIARESFQNAERITKDTISKLFDTEWVNRIAYVIAIERDANALAQLEAMPEMYWGSTEGMKYLQIASNYKPYILRAAERKPTFESEAIKAKVLHAVKYFEESRAAQMVAEKLQNAPVASVDDSAL
jgi:ATP/maltotriose-dependent transcriptional regulator MalT